MNALAIKLPQVETAVAIDGSWLEKRDAMLAESKLFVSIENNESFQAATESLSAITKHSNALEKFRKEVAEPYQEAAKCIKMAADKARDALELEKARIKALLGDYAERQRKAAEAEMRRIEAEQRAAAEAAVAKQQEAEDMGFDVVATPAPAAAPQPQVIAPKAFGAAISERVTFEIVDADAVPRGFCVPDERLINAFIRDNRNYIKDQIKSGREYSFIAGVKFTVKTDVASR